MMVDSDHPRENMWRKKPPPYSTETLFARTPHIVARHIICWSERRACGLSQRLGPIGAIIVGVVAGTVALLLGQVAFATMLSPLIRFMVALLFAAPAALMCYRPALGLAHAAIPGEGERAAIAIGGAISLPATASYAWRCSRTDLSDLSLISAWSLQPFDAA
jgi:hypothetical protein